MKEFILDLNLFIIGKINKKGVYSVVKIVEDDREAMNFAIKLQKKTTGKVVINRQNCDGTTELVHTVTNEDELIPLPNYYVVTRIEEEGDVPIAVFSIYYKAVEFAREMPRPRHYVKCQQGGKILKCKDFPKYGLPVAYDMPSEHVYLVYTREEDGELRLRLASPGMFEIKDYANKLVKKGYRYNNVIIYEQIGARVEQSRKFLFG